MSKAELGRHSAADQCAGVNVCWVRAVADVPPLTLLLFRAAPSTSHSIRSLVWREQVCTSLFEAFPQHICALARIYLQFPEALLHLLSLCLFSLPGNTLCSSCLSSSPSFLSSSPTPPWETLHCTWPSFQSGATFTDVSSLCLIILYLELERACQVIKLNGHHYTKPDPIS